jgi:hypothetical protein
MSDLSQIDDATFTHAARLADIIIGYEFNSGPREKPIVLNESNGINDYDVPLLIDFINALAEDNNLNLSLVHDTEQNTLEIFHK